MPLKSSCSGAALALCLHLRHPKPRLSGGGGGAKGGRVSVGGAGGDCTQGGGRRGGLNEVKGGESRRESWGLKQNSRTASQVSIHCKLPCDGAFSANVFGCWS